MQYVKAKLFLINKENKMEDGQKEGVVDALKSYSAFVFGKKSLGHLKELCLQGKAGELKIRTFCWRVFPCLC